jgi:diguanylate cyclase (GGDEF)-like protein
MVELHRQLEEKNLQLEKLALTDALTGLPNRRAIEMWAQHQLSAAARHHFPVWVVILDLDHFKSVNDTYGHDAGDTVLKSFSELLRTNTRQSNICGRLGGEEFFLALTHVSEEQVQVALERIRSAFAREQFQFVGRTVTCTASFGVAGLKASDRTSFCDLLSQADGALYQAKRKGRNCVEFGSEADLRLKQNSTKEC